MNINLSSSVLRQYSLAAIVNIGSLTTGISLAWPSPTIVKLHNGTDTPLWRPITDEEGSWIVSGGYLAAIATNFLGGILIDKIGRKYCIILITIPRICVSVWIIFVTEVWMMILCRAIMVLTDCYIFVAVPVYVSEIASKEHRGVLGTFLHINSCIGTVLTLIIGPFVSYRFLNVALASIIIVASIPLPFLPDSPVYLHSKGYIEESIKVLSHIRDSDEIVKQEIEDYKLSTQKKINKIALFKNKLFLKSLTLGFLICGGSNALGYSAVSLYLQTILESTQTNVQPEIASVVVGCIQLLSAISTLFFTKIFGRRPILIYSIVGLFFGLIVTPSFENKETLSFNRDIRTAVTMATVTIAIHLSFYVFDIDNVCLLYKIGLGIFFKISTAKGYMVTGLLNYLPTVSLILITYCYNAGIGCLIVVVTAELFDGPARAIGCSLCFLSTLLLSFLTSKHFAEMISVVGPSETYWFFSAICVLIGSLIAIFVPETKGKTFREIQFTLRNQTIIPKKNTNDTQEC